MKNNGECVTPTRVAEVFGVHPASVHRWIRDGVLRAMDVRVRMGRPTYRITREAFELFMRERGMTDPEIIRALRK